MNNNTQERLTAAELDIMLCLWKYTQPVRTARLLEDLQPVHSWTLSTLKVLLGRLEEKGYVQVTRQGRFTLYQPLVAEAEGRIVGHVLFTKAEVQGHPVLALAPLSVLPEQQRKGIGTALIKEGHRIAAELGFPYSVVLGSENYYPRSGYTPADVL